MSVCKRCGRDVDGIHTCTPPEVYRRSMNAKERLEKLIEAWAKDAAYHPTPSDLFQLADRIESAGLLAPEWVSVKERLPERGTFVLVCTDVGRIMKDYRGITGWDTMPDYVVTHWQPLPSAPKESK